MEFFILAGRPTKYCKALIDTICERIASGESVLHISRDKDMPSQDCIYRWLNNYHEFYEKYTEAKAKAAELMAEQILDIADDSGVDVIVDKDGNHKIDGECVARARLRVDTRKWYLSKVLPKKFGERVVVDLGDVTLDALMEGRKRVAESRNN